MSLKVARVRCSHMFSILAVFFLPPLLAPRCVALHPSSPSPLPNHTLPHHTTQAFWTKLGTLVFEVNRSCKPLAVDMDSHVERAVRGFGCARRRRERRLLSALRHEQRNVAMAVCTALHHSCNKTKKKEVGTNRHRRSWGFQAYQLRLWVKGFLWTRSRSSLWETWTASCCLFHMLWCRLTNFFPAAKFGAACSCAAG